ncbi:ThuA domain-containing protein [Mumia sp. zg.B53]|uniref:ThuA domain-containing protein n=1 Tax=Mumia sp. zg.B53 TaxID=2855449 RepID=UPI001C6E1B25|nr:ThuA domain-containing protein [Mumia sp. zg.B53]MBW9213708.1 ThuA domain-containing protein [Mumia sp. zg.B53]
MRIRTVLAGAAALLVGATVLAAWPSTADRGGPRWAVDDDSRADYGVCRGTDPGCYHDWETAFKTDGVDRVLVYSATGVSRHAHLGPRLAPGMNPPLTDAHVAQQAMRRWGTEHGLSVDWTEDVLQLDSPGKLLRYDAVVFLSNSRDILDDAAQTSLMQYVRAGGGFVAVHNTLGAEYHWPYFQGLLGGAAFYDHGPSRNGHVEKTSRRDVSVADLPKRFVLKDEFYNLVPFPTGVRILAEVDPDTLEGGGKGFNGHPGHPDQHPVTWCQYYDGGRAWVTSLGHEVALWRDGDGNGDADEQARLFKSHVVNGLLSTMGKKAFCRA